METGAVIMVQSKKSQDVVIPHLSDAEIRNIDTMDAAIAALGGDVVAVFSESGEWDVVADKGTLVKVPFVGLRWRFTEGDMGSFVSLEIVTEDGRRLVVNDGSTGIYRQLRTLTDETGRMQGITCRKGLRRSDYTYADEKGLERPATTFYLA